MSKSFTTISKLAFPLVAAGLVLGATIFVIGTATTPNLLACVMPSSCDFLTGGGWIVYHGAKGTFGVGGGCKHGSGINGVPYWGHLEYIDHSTSPGLNVHATEITAYIFQDIGVDFDANGHPVGERIICGNARTNLFGDSAFAVRAVDRGEPGVNDNFDIRVTSPDGTIVQYDTSSECRWHFLGSDAPCAAGSGGGGNIQLHKPNPSTTGTFGGSCPAMFTGAL